MKYFGFLVLLVLLIGGVYLWQDRAPIPNYSGIQISHTLQSELKVGEGAVAQSFSTVQVHYAAWIYDPAKPGNKGELFASTEFAEPPVAMKLKDSDYDGWQLGIIGMKVDGKRQLIVPFRNGGEIVRKSIPAGMILLIEVSLFDVKE